MVKFTMYPDLAADTAHAPYSVIEEATGHLERFHDLKGVLRYILNAGERECEVSVLGARFRLEIDEITD